MDLPIPNFWEIHPMLVHFPVALLLTGVVAEFLARKRPTLTRPAAGLLVAGAVLGWLAAAAGLLSFYTVPAHTDDAHTLMWWHLGFAVATLLLFSWVCVKRWKARASSASGSQLAAESFGALLLLITAYLGGVIVYHGGAGIAPELLSPEIREGHSHDGSHGRKGPEQEDGHEHGSEPHNRGASCGGHNESTGAQPPAVSPESNRIESLDFKMPESLRLRHEAFQTDFTKATKEHGKVGEAARAIEKLGNTHFAKAKDVFPALGLLPLLAEGKATPEMAPVCRITDHLRSALPQIRTEHRELVAGLKNIAETARQEGKTEYVHFVERLILHIQEEEQVLYPTVLLVGELVQLKLAHE